jgi:hypothetical protein
MTLIHLVEAERRHLRRFENTLRSPREDVLHLDGTSHRAATRG